MRKNIVICFVFLLALIVQAYSQSKPPSQAVFDAPYPKIRIWTSPSKGEEPRFNSPSFQWPSTKKANYSVRLSSSRDFSKQVFEKSGLPYAMFNPHTQLATGKWYWQFKTNEGAWNPIDSFVITPSTRQFPTPDSKAMMSAITSEHPRVLVKKQELSGFRMKSIGQKETSLIIQ
jgi:hypothetical protein